MPNEEIKEQAKTQEGKHIKKENKPKKRRMSKRAVFAMALAAIMTVGCGYFFAKWKESPSDLSDITLEEILDENGDNKSLDEILSDPNEMINVSGEQVQIMDAVKKLETIVENTQVYEEIAALNLDEDIENKSAVVEQATGLDENEIKTIEDELENDALAYTRTLIHEYKKGNNIEKGRIAYALKYIQKQYEDDENWKLKNGITVLKSLLTKAFVSSALDAYWGDTAEAFENYKVVEIEGFELGEDEGHEKHEITSAKLGPLTKPLIIITLDDYKGGKSDKLTLPMVASDELRDAYNYIVMLNSLDMSTLSGENINKIIDKGYNIVLRISNKSTNEIFGFAYTYKQSNNRNAETSTEE